MSDIFQEVQEEYRREQLAQAWTKYRVPTIAAAGALVLAVAAYQGWSYWHGSKVDASSRQFDTANQLIGGAQGQTAPAAFAKLANEGWGGYPFAARLQEAAARAAIGDSKGAASIYDSIAEAGDGGALFADYARVRAAILLVDTAPLAEIKKRLDSVAGSDSPWRVEAEEFLAYAYWRAGNKTEALRLLDLIKNNPAATSGVKQRALEFSAMIGGGMTVADLKAAAPAATPGGLLIPELPNFDVPPTPGAPPAPTTPTAPTTSPAAPPGPPAPPTHTP